MQKLKSTNLLFLVWLLLMFLPVCHAQRQKKNYSETEKTWIKQEKQREHDSIRNLFATGKADTIQYSYEVGFNMTLEARPRVDFIKNRVGDKDSGISWTLLGITILLVYFCSKLIIKRVYKERPTYLSPYITIYLLGGFSIYFLLSCIYSNLDEIMLREYGKEKTAILLNDSIWHNLRSISTRNTKYITPEPTFMFTDDRGVRVCVNQENAKFDVNDYKSKNGISIVKVRYDSDSRKLSIDDNKYFMQNLNRIMWICLLLLLFFLFCLGRFNQILDAINQKIKKRIEKSRQVKPYTEEFKYEPIEVKDYILYPDENNSVDTYWTFTGKEYESIDEFVRDVRASEQQCHLDAEDCLNPDRVFLTVPRMVFTFDDDEVIGKNDLCIEIISDDRTSITEGELLFKLHNSMIPYLDRLVNCTLEAVIPIGNIEGEDSMDCSIIFADSDELEKPDE